MLGRKQPKAKDETQRAKTDNYSGSYYDAPSDFEVIERVQEVAKQKGIPAAQLALAWMMNKPEITAPIIGATKPGHIEDAVAALSVKLTEAEIKQVEELYRPHRVIGFGE